MSDERALAISISSIYCNLHMSLSIYIHIYGSDNKCGFGIKEKIGILEYAKNRLQNFEGFFYSL